MSEPPDSSPLWGGTPGVRCCLHVTVTMTRHRVQVTTLDTD